MGVMYIFSIHFKQHRERRGGKKCKSKYFTSPAFPDKSSCLFVQVALWRVMSLKCQSSVWACIRYKAQFSTHKKTGSQPQCYTERNKIWSLHFPSPWRHCALIICQSDRCFSNDGVSCVLNFYQSPSVRDCGMLCAIWWNPPRTQSQCWEAFLQGRLTTEEDVVRVVCYGDGRDCMWGAIRPYRLTAQDLEFCNAVNCFIWKPCI